MSNEFLTGPNRSRRYIIVGAIAATLIAGGIVGWATRSTPNPDKQSAAPATASPSAAASAQPSGPLRLVPGEKSLEGIRTGYPHTTAGAVSAAVEVWSQSGSTLDPNRAGLVGKLFADGSWGNAEARFAQGPVNTRKSLSLPPDGPVPTGASIVLGPVAYQLRDVTADRMTVLLLGYLTTSDVAGRVQTKISVFPTLMRWDGNDWKISDRGNDASVFADLVARPGTPEFAAAGWQELIP